MTNLRLSAIATIASTSCFHLLLPPLASTSCFLASCGEKKNTEAAANTEVPEAQAEAAKPDTYESLTDEIIVQLNNLGDAMALTKDKASSEEFVKKLATIGDEIEDIGARFDKLEPLSDEDIARTEEKIKKSTKGFEKKFEDFFVAFVMNDEIGPNVGAGLTKFQKRMDKLPDVFARGDKKKEASAPQAPGDPAPLPTPQPAAQ